MQLTQEGLVLVSQFGQQLEQLTGDAGVCRFVLPTLNLFSTSIATLMKEQLRLKLVSLTIQHESYQNVVNEYQRLQSEYFRTCMMSLANFMQRMCDNKNSITTELNRLIDFIEYDQLTLLSLIDPVFLDRINPAVKLRITYYLLESGYALLFDIHKNKQIKDVVEYDQATLSRLDQLIAKTENSSERKRQLAVLFDNELHIREASILATGELPRPDQLSDIYVVYKTASFGWAQRSQDHAASYYNLAVKTLLQLAQASRVVSANSATGQLSFYVNPISQETRLGSAGLVRSSAFGINIAHEDTELNPLSAGVGAQEYQLVKNYSLGPSLKIACLQHIEQLSRQLEENPRHAHTQRRIEKKCALEAIVRAEEQGYLSPATFADIITLKPYIFVALGMSKTQMIIEWAQNDLKEKMWLKLSQDKQCIGKFGYAISDTQLIATLFRKYQTLEPGATYDTTKQIAEMLCFNSARMHYSGYELWRFDKRRALEVILIAHAQHLLHPALIVAIEEIYPCVYSRSLHFLFKSEVERIVTAVKDNIIELFWQDAQNDNSYTLPYSMRK